MLETNGITPKLQDQVCEELICQQFWLEGKLVNEVDVLYIKTEGRWHQLYFDEGIVFWRPQQQAPQPFAQSPGDVFAYPFVDVAQKYQLRDRMITSLNVEPLLQGVRVSFSFEKAGTVIVSHKDSTALLRFIPQA